MVILFSTFSNAQFKSQTKLGEVIVSNGVICHLPRSCENSFLRVEKVLKGALIEVYGDHRKGWYRVRHLESRRTGYLHGNNFKFLQEDNIESPKEIILVDEDGEPYREESRVVEKKRIANKIFEKCPENLSCSEIDTLYNLLKTNSKVFEKGKFEKTIEWHERMKGVLNTIKDKKGNPIAYGKKIFSHNLDVTVLYDADKEVWTFLLNSTNLDTSNNCLRVLGKSGEERCLVLSNKKLHVIADERIILKMPPKIAQLHDNKLRLGFIGEISYPFIWNGYDNQKGLYFTLDKIIIFNISTGEVFDKFFYNSIKSFNENKPQKPQGQTKPKTKPRKGDSNKPKKAKETKPKKILPKQPIAKNTKVILPRAKNEKEEGSEESSISIGPLIGYATKRVNPVYPKQARAMRIKGIVKIEVEVNEKGKVTKIGKISGPSLLKRAALDAVRKWEFKPFTVNGKNVNVNGFISFNFNL